MPQQKPTATKRKSPIALSLSEDLEAYLRSRAKESFRSVTGEIAMRLEASRKADLAPTQGVDQ